MRKHFLLAIVLLVFSAFTYAQQGTVTGTVKAEDGSPLPGATVQIKGTTNGTVTDLDGKYTLPVAGVENPILVFSYVGYLTEEVAVAGQTKIDMQLVTNISNVDEVVVIGYGQQKKSLVTGAIAKVGTEELSKATATRFEQALEGKTAGVFVAQNSGAPGAALTIKIRGNASDGTNEPIYIVDGVKTGGLEYLNTSDIESVEVLKDAASSAIYGSNGGNGVIMITTKKGKKGEGQINYQFTYGEQKAASLPSVMNSQQYKDYFLEATHWEKSHDSVNYIGIDGTKGTNWVDQVFQKAPMTEHQLNFSGGNDKSTYFISASQLNQDGIVGGSKNNMTRYTFRTNVETEVKSWFSAGVNASYSHFKKRPLDAAEQYAGITTTAMRYDPTIPVYYNDTSEITNAFYKRPDILYAMNKNEDGKYYSISTRTGGEMWNPVAKIDYTQRSEVQDKVLGDIHTDLKPVSWAKLTSRLYTDYSYQVTKRFNGKTMYGVSDQVTADSMTNATESWDRWFKYGIENFVTFSHKFGKHSAELMVGQNYENYKHIWQQVYAYDIPYGDIFYSYPSLSQSPKKTIVTSYVGTDDEEIELDASYFGRFMYNYDEKYLVQGSLRKDGSSKFGTNEQFKPFPSFSLGWNVSREGFFTSVSALSFISDLKLRGSWGKNGSTQNLPHFPYMTTLNVVNYADGTDAGNLLVGKVPGTPGNPSLSWETNIQTNVGADFGFFKNALLFSLDWFKRTTTDQLADKSDQPYYVGLTGTAKINSGKIQNKGWEFNLSYRGNVSEFKYTISGNASYLKNKVIDYGVKAGKDGAAVGQLGTPTRYDIGEPVWYFYGYKSLGIFQNQAEIDAYVDSAGNKIQPAAIPGDVKWADLDHNGIINANDREKLGKSLPDWTYGITLGAEFKGLDFSAFFQGVEGNDIFWASYRTDNLRTNRQSVWYEDRWTGEGTSNTYPRATLHDNNGNYRVSSLNVYKGNYIRLKNLTLGYTLPEKLTKKVAISKLRIFYTGTNLVTFTKYPGIDPEVGNANTDNPSWLGIDFGNYPTTKINTVGVQVTF